MGATPSSPRSAAGAAAVDLWLLRAADIDEARIDETVLDVEESRRADNRMRPDQRQCFVRAHVMLRQLLSNRLGVPPGEISYSSQPCPSCGCPHGRPMVDGASPPTHFSLSRRGGLFLIGIAPVPLGVDVEAFPEIGTVHDVITLLHPEERSEILAADPSEQSARFACIWTRKEAYLKGIGVGVTADLASDYLGAADPGATPPGWTVASIPVGSGYAGAVAVWGATRLTVHRR